MTFYHPVTPTMETIKSFLLLVASILGVVICNELESYDINHILSNRMKNPGTQYRQEMRADSLSSNEEVNHLSTSTSRGVFP